MEDIVLCGLWKAYGQRQVLRDVSGAIPAGAVTGLMAPSGAGKTTLLRILMGFEQADRGSIRGLASLRLSAVFQEDRLCPQLDALSNLRLTNPALSREAALAALGAVGLAQWAFQRTGDLSGGQRRRIAILRSLLADYDLLLLDEPFRGLDRETRAHVWADTRRRCAGKTVLVVTHDPADLRALGAAARLTGLA